MTTLDPVAYVVTGAARYAGRTLPRVDFDAVTVDVARAHKIAGAYLDAPAHDPAALPAYVALRQEIRAQLAFMIEKLGVRVEVCESDPYVTLSGAPNSRAMRRDVRENRRIRVLSTAVTGSHPFLSDADNDAFRAVHDVLGHCHAGSDFSAGGEERAYRAHALLFSPLALQALATETRGQNSANNYGGLPAGTYAEQKLCILPDWAILP